MIGWFYDGRSTARHEVTLEIDPASQSLLLRAAHGLVDRWPLPEIRLVERPIPGVPLRYRRADQDGPRLTAGPDSLAALTPYCPDLRRTPPRERQVGRIAFWAGAAVLGVMGLVLFSLPYFAHELAQVFPPAVEAKLGQGTEKTIRLLLGGGKTAPLCRAPAGRAALNRLVDRLTEAGDLRSRPVVEVIDVPVMNAVALPGNRVLVFRQLLDEAPNADALAGVLGHEFGHIRLRHPIEATIRQSGLSLLIGLLIGDVYGGSVAGGAALVLVNSAYSRDDERAADQAAVTTLAAAGIDSAGMASFFEQFQQTERKAGLDKWPGFAMSHPGTAERIEMIRRAGKPGEPAMSDADWKDLKAICSDEQP